VLVAEIDADDRQGAVGSARPKRLWLTIIILVLNFLALASLASLVADILFRVSGAASATRDVGLVLFCVLGLASAFGLLRMTSRSRSLGLLVSVLGLALWGAVLGLSFFGPNPVNGNGEISIPGAILLLCVEVFTLVAGIPPLCYAIWYLTRPSVKTLFSHQK
jgi:hypothetical protein